MIYYESLNVNNLFSTLTKLKLYNIIFREPVQIISFQITTSSMIEINIFWSYLISQKNLEQHKTFYMHDWSLDKILENVCRTILCLFEIFIHAFI